MTALTSPSFFGCRRLLVFAEKILKANAVGCADIVAATTKSRLGSLFKKICFTMDPGRVIPIGIQHTLQFITFPRAVDGALDIPGFKGKAADDFAVGLRNTVTDDTGDSLYSHLLTVAVACENGFARKHAHLRVASLAEITQSPFHHFHQSPLVGKKSRAYLSKSMTGNRPFTINLLVFFRFDRVRKQLI